MNEPKHELERTLFWFFFALQCLCSRAFLLSTRASDVRAAVDCFRHADACVYANPDTLVPPETP